MLQEDSVVMRRHGKKAQWRRILAQAIIDYGMFNATSKRLRQEASREAIHRLASIYKMSASLNKRNRELDEQFLVDEKEDCSFE